MLTPEKGHDSMIKTLLAIACALIGSISLLTAEEVAGKKKIPWIIGTLTAVDASGVAITSTGDTPKITALTVSDKTKITVDRKKAAIADLKVGDKVRARADGAEATRLSIKRTETHGKDGADTNDADDKDDDEAKKDDAAK
jgi:hypothetical protein